MSLQFSRLQKNLSNIDLSDISRSYEIFHQKTCCNIYITLSAIKMLPRFAKYEIRLVTNLCLNIIYKTRSIEYEKRHSISSVGYKCKFLAKLT